jgi:hypothetical protein
VPERLREAPLVKERMLLSEWLRLMSRGEPPQAPRAWIPAPANNPPEGRIDGLTARPGAPPADREPAGWL